MRREQGSVSAEFAVTLPAVLVVLGVALGAVTLAGDQAWLASAAGWAARAIAIGGDSAESLRVAVAGRQGISTHVVFEGAEVCVTLTRDASAPLEWINASAVGHACARRVL